MEIGDLHLRCEIGDLMATPLEDLRILQNIEEVADSVWHVVASWGNFERDTIGKQLVRAVDSIGANVAESYGRFHYGEKIQFLYYGRGSLFETKYWLNRSYARQLIHEAQLQQYAQQLNKIGRQLNTFAQSLKQQRTKNNYTVKEPELTYEVNNLLPQLFTKNELDWLASTETNNLQSLISNLTTNQSPQGTNHDRN